MAALDTQYKADGIHEIALTSAIRTNYAREVVKWPHNGLSCIAFEVLQLEKSKLAHRAFSNDQCLKEPNKSRYDTPYNLILPLDDYHTRISLQI